MMTGFVMERGVDVFLSGMAVRGAVLLSLSALAAVILRRRSAAGRHWAWLLGLVGLLVLPVAGLLGPRWSVPLPVVTGAAIARGVADGTPGTEAPAKRAGGWASATPMGVDATSRERGAASKDAGARPAAKSGDSEPPTAAVHEAPAIEKEAVPEGVSGASPIGASVPVGGMSTTALLLTLWVAGAAALLIRLLGSHLAVRRLEAASTRFASGPVTDAARRLTQTMGVPRSVRILQGPVDAIPMSWGLARPTVLLPRGAEGWGVGRLEAVLVHELAHVRRRDCLSQFAAELAVAVHWFNPLAWFAVHRLRVEREHACDDEVLNRGARATQYASELVALAREIRFGAAPAVATVAILGPADLKSRVRAVLDAGRPRTLPARAALAGAMVAGAVVLAVATVTPAQAGEADEEDPLEMVMPGPAADEEDRVAVESPRDEGGLLPAPPVADGSKPFQPVSDGFALTAPQAATCGMATEGWERSSSRSEDGDHYRLEWSRSGCSVDVRVEGDIDFNDDFTGVSRVGSGAYLRIEERDGGTQRWLEVTAGSGGAPAFEFRLDGRNHAFDADARAWYAAMLLQVVRRTGFHAEERVAGLLRSGGTQAVLTELDQLKSDHVFSAYTEQLFRQADLTESQAVGLVERARREVDSDHYMSGILMALDEGSLTSERGMDVFLGAATTLESDHYRAQVLGHALEQRTLTQPQVAALIAAVAGMESDHYVAAVLDAVATRYFLDESMRATYLRAVTSVESDHYRAEILGALLDRNDLSGEELGDVLSAVGSMSSDHYKTELLKRFVSDPLSGPEMDRFVEIIAGMESDHYQSEALLELSLTDLTDAQLLRVIDAVAVIESDHYQAALLVEIAGQSRVHEGALYDAMLRAMNTLDSQHYRGQVAERLLRR
jgi:beta-lactamase regulating signal transducer with metallopeptidase domain